jgi:tetratricopeptide (TPR) repeat protein
MLFLSTAYLQSEQHDKMQIILERLHKDQPSNFEVSNTLFDLYSKKSDFANLFRILESSEKYFDAAQTIEVYNNIGINLLSADFKKDSTFIRSFISRFDERLYFDWISQSIAGKLSSNILDNEATIIFFERALFLNDTNSFIYLDAAISYYTLKLYQKSIELLKVGQAKFPDDSRFDYYLCNAYMLTKDYVTAESYGEKLFQSDSSNILFINLYASILQELEKYEKSDSLYELSLSIDPDDANTNNNYAYSLSIRSKELSKAQMLSHSSLQSEPDNSAFLDTFGWIQFKKGNLESALEYVQKAIDVGEFSSEVFEHLGDIYIGLDNKPAALEAYLKSLELADVKKSEVVDKINLLKD